MGTTPMNIMSMPVPGMVVRVTKIMVITTTARAGTTACSEPLQR